MQQSNNFQSIKDLDAFCEDATQASRCGVVSDFLKQVGVYYINLKRSNQTMSAEETAIVANKYAEFKALFDKIVGSDEFH